MKEIKKILSKYSQIDFNSRKAAIATVVRVDGSSYRRPGARMLMTDDGKWEGAISGGCLEGDALRKSRQVILSQKPMLVLYDTNDNGTGNLGVGLGCNGIIEVLIEPIDEKNPLNPVQALKNLLEKKEPTVIATVFMVEGKVNSEVGERIILQDNKVFNYVENTDLGDFLIEESKVTLSMGKSVTKTYQLPEGTIRVFIEVIQPDIHLVIFGGGYDAIPVVRQAKEIGWKVILTDECIAHLLPTRFPDSDAIVPSKRESFLETIEFTKRTAVVMMTHSYQYDKSVLKQLMNTPAGYIGVLGPKVRFEKMLNDWKSEGLAADQFISRINSPAGLDIGAESPEEIALSIISEINAHFAKRSGGFLNEKEGPIHLRDKEVTAEVSFVPLST